MCVGASVLCFFLGVLGVRVGSKELACQPRVDPSPISSSRYLRLNGRYRQRVNQQPVSNSHNSLGSSSDGTGGDKVLVLVDAGSWIPDGDTLSHGSSSGISFHGRRGSNG